MSETNFKTEGGVLMTARGARGAHPSPFSDDLVQSYRVLAAAKAPEAVFASLRQGGYERSGEKEDSRDDGFHCSG